MKGALTVIPACFVAFLLLWVMQQMVGVEGQLGDPGAVYSVEFVRLKRDTEVETRRRELPEKMLEEEPPIPEIAQAALEPGSGVEDTLPIMAASVDLGDPSDVGVAAGSDTDIIPLVRVEPLYPAKALQAGVSGWVEIRFTITAVGTVKSPRVFRYFPSRIFNRTALQAIRKWKYAPKIENGRAVERPGVEVHLEFRIENQVASGGA
jgi:protein TonB